jgi:hypothetical protein
LYNDLIEGPKKGIRDGVRRTTAKDIIDGEIKRGISSFLPIITKIIHEIIFSKLPQVGTTD